MGNLSFNVPLFLNVLFTTGLSSVSFQYPLSTLQKWNERVVDDRWKKELRRHWAELVKNDNDSLILSSSARVHSLAPRGGGGPYRNLPEFGQNWQQRQRSKLCEFSSVRFVLDQNVISMSLFFLLQAFK